ncbi:MAG: Holliday junction resolvase RuvX [Parcubacteria group bacterium CG_4_9_14_0_2_um_filter_41_8]|nr:MAG: hypothetical protein AUJ34_01305 [Parcubacteria group bacterium CG1_02_41_12]PIQ79391.1 MAG: Holliday junction resolvase RuvX [Parcubacteria group bacterium CG11_big_fil_rev_8_21_14_0_20_41_14]PIR57531.1 MAG: Holliday junction resolvase RuvX [Parcubacteria group bacterium CG10_big_fil_rev_8_21_14_0_10_41_35]PIZ81407.1 MAG: Holliday junction resolvase RuvX [Parcubacteria group bacterium CG_4_10_14_0_2_um_filter_41_6]PJC40330.1 MAG: Holliday junction resolvase RuvX [Parcubacteria group ba
MKTYLGIDYGKSKIGLAKGTDETRVATPMRILENNEKAIKLLDEIVDINEIDEIVVGYPLSLSGEVGPQAREVDAFIEEVAQAIDKPVNKQDERFSSRSAVSKGDDDASAAALILQTYLERISNN